MLCYCNNTAVPKIRYEVFAVAYDQYWIYMADTKFSIWQLKNQCQMMFLYLI